MTNDQMHCTCMISYIFFYILFLFVESVNIRVEEGVDVQTTCNLLENKTIIQDVFHEVNESSDKTNLNAKPS